MRSRLLPALIILAALLMPGLAAAHQSSVSYSHVRLAGGAIDYELKLSSRDLYEALGLPADRDASDTEIEAGRAALDAYVSARVTFTSDGRACTLEVRDIRVIEQLDRFAALRYGVYCPPGGKRLRLGYRLFFELDPRHTGLLSLTRGEKTITQPDLIRPTGEAPEANSREWDLETTRADLRKGHLDWIVDGMMHIYTGYDHIAFLLALLLVAAARRAPDGTWQARTVREESLYVVRVVTAFTIAHSTTLIFAALDYVQLPGRLVECAIAASIVYVAVENLIVGDPRHRWPLAFGFGLVHGFGFAGVLAPMLPPSGVIVPLLELNVGVELGQISIVMVVLPLLIAIARANPARYRRVVVVGGSTVIATFGLIWLIERVVGVTILSRVLG